jgi:hypothetical protein
VNAGTNAAIDTTGTHDGSCQRPNVIAAPSLTSAATGDFTEQSASVTVNAGAACGGTGPASLDLAGTAREYGSGIDIGAYELGPPTPPAGGTPGGGTAGAGGTTGATVAQRHRLTLSATVEAGTATATGSLQLRPAVQRKKRSG